MEEFNTDPPLALHVVWHPESADGEYIGGILLDHFGSHRYMYVSGGDRVRVMFRNAIAPGAHEPLPIDWDGARTSAVLVLLDNTLVKDQSWLNYTQKLVEATGFRVRVIPVALEAGALGIGLVEQALKWHDWPETGVDKERRLFRELKYAFSLMLRHQLAELRHPLEDRDALGDYLEKVRVFLSHSKHDAFGESTARKLRRWLNENSDMATFLDIRNIPPGVPFDSVINYEVANSVMVAIYTDSYSSREWCRREVVRAKRLGVPMLTVNCLQEFDERFFPYLGNVPSVRMDPETMDRLGYVADYLLDEVFKDFLWQCRVEGFRKLFPETNFLARAPELILLASRPEASIGTNWDIVYPGPPLSTEEIDLFADISGDVRLYSLIEWLAWREL